MAQRPEKLRPSCVELVGSRPPLTPLAKVTAPPLPWRVGFQASPLPAEGTKQDFPGKGRTRDHLHRGPAVGRLLACQASRQSFLGSLPGHLGVLSRPRGQVKAPEGCSRGPRGRPTQRSLGYSTSRTFSGHRHTATPALSPLAQTTPNHFSTPFPHAASQAALSRGHVCCG